MKYVLNGEERELNFVDNYEDIYHRSRIVDVAAKSYVEEGCPSLLEYNTFVLAYYSLMTNMEAEDDAVILEISQSIDKSELPYFDEMYDAFIKKISFLISEQGIKTKLFETLSNLNVLIKNYSEPKTADKLLKTLIKEFGKLDAEHTKIILPYIESSLSSIAQK